MKVFLRWWLNSLAMLGAVVILLAVIMLLQGDADSGKLRGLGSMVLIVVIGATILAAVFTLLELVYVPWRIKHLEGKVAKLFGGRATGTGWVECQVGEFNCYVMIRVLLSFDKKASGERIAFCIDQAQIEALTKKPDFEYVSMLYHELPVCRVHETNSWGIKKAKKKLEEAFHAQ